jgi:hypothetical protein
MMICRICGDPVAGTLNYCPRCSAPLQVPGMAPGSDPSRSYPYRPAPSGGVPPELAEFGDLFAGAPATGPFPTLPAPEPEAGEELDDTASRLLYPPPGPGRRAAGHRAKVTTAALAAVAVLGGLAIAWAAFGRHQVTAGGQLAGRQTAATGQASPAPRARTAPSALPSGPAAGPPTGSPASSPTGTPTAPGPAPGGGAAPVTMAPGVSQVPDSAQVDGFLVSYFAAINAHDYQQYAGLLSPGRRKQLTAADFAQGYGTTTDTAASVVGISVTGPAVAATVTFTSRQQSVPGADITGCTRWEITLYLRKHDGTLLIATPPAAYHASQRACP